jgi:hypothetical protein
VPGLPSNTSPKRSFLKGRLMPFVEIRPRFTKQPGDLCFTNLKLSGARQYEADGEALQRGRCFTMSDASPLAGQP